MGHRDRAFWSVLSAVLWLLCSLFVIFAVPAYGQVTTVTAVVKDVNGIAYGGAQVKAQLVTTAGSPITGQPTVTNNSSASCKQAGFGNAPCQIPFQGTFGPTFLDNAGNFPGGGIQLQDNTQVTPASTQWLITVTTNGNALPIGTGAQICQAQVTISGGSQSVSASFAACPALINTITSSGTVASVSSGSLSPLFTVTVNTPTTTPAFVFTAPTQNANLVYAGPGSGGAAVPGFRALVSADVPPINLASSANGGVIGNLPVANLAGGVGASASTVWCGNGTWCAPTATGVVSAYSITTESADTALTSGTLTTVITKAVTMPASGCPCRVSVIWMQYLTSTGSGQTADLLVSDGSNVFAEGEREIDIVGNAASQTGSGYSPVTYANSANITFTLKIQVNGSGTTARAAAFQSIGMRNSRLEIAVFTSN